MRGAHPVERAVGIEHYVTEADGIGGRLKASPEEFRVCEVEAFDVQPVDAEAGSYPHLVVRATLSNWDTNDFAARVADAVGMSRERVSWAGTKDKRAVTTQLFSLDGLDPGDVPDVNGADVEVVGRAGRPVLFGDLAGNEFEVVVRDPDRPDLATDVARELAAFGEAGDPAAVEGLPGKSEGDGNADHGRRFEDGTTVGVPNYFGQQRFGSKRPVTHEVGLAIVRDDWEAAVLSYVGNPGREEPAATREAREYVEETRDWTAALERFPRRLGYERAMLHELADGGDFRDALESLPTNLQQLFVHAAQSYAFNRIVSERLERGIPLGRPVEGDVVCFSDRDAPSGFPLPDTDRTQRVTARRVETTTKHCDRGRAFVTGPLVGTGTELAEGEPGEIEREVLSDLDLAPGDFALPGEFDSSGDRRALLVRTDLSLALDPPTFEFRLPRGSYATVLLREFLKVPPVEMD